MQGVKKRCLIFTPMNFLSSLLFSLLSILSSPRIVYRTGKKAVTYFKPSSRLYLVPNFSLSSTAFVASNDSIIITTRTL